MKNSYKINTPPLVIGIILAIFTVIMLIFNTSHLPPNHEIVKGTITGFDKRVYRHSSNRGDKQVRFHKQYEYTYHGEEHMGISEVGGTKVPYKKIHIFVNKDDPSESVPVIDYLKERIFYGFLLLCSLIAIIGGLVPQNSKYIEEYEDDCEDEYYEDMDA